MKKTLFATLLISLLACAACTRDQVVTALTDARWGLSEGCSQNWVPTDDCKIADDGLSVAIVVAKQASANQVKPAVVQAIKDTEVKLGTTSKAIPYIDYLIEFLS